jgi:hypothetical protein
VGKSCPQCAQPSQIAGNSDRTKKEEKERRGPTPKAEHPSSLNIRFLNFLAFGFWNLYQQIPRFSGLWPWTKTISFIGSEVLRLGLNYNVSFLVL